MQYAVGGSQSFINNFLITYLIAANYTNQFIIFLDEHISKICPQIQNPIGLRTEKFQRFF